MYKHMHLFCWKIDKILQCGNGQTMICKHAF